jgi:mobilome CxxCx(11)CxxC protein
MLDATTRARIEQERLNCLCAVYLHTQALRTLDWKITLVDAAALIVPVLYFPARYWSKDTPYSDSIELAWEFTAACLIALTIWKFVARWQERFKNHGRLLGENIALKRQAVDLLTDDRATIETAQSFLALAERSETADRELLLEPKKKEQQYAYRQALKELGGTSVVCPLCNSSPWKFISGSCDTCGNTPAAIKSN